MKKSEWIKYFVLGKYDQFLQFLGLRIPDAWILLRAIHNQYGEEKAKAAFTVAAILRCKYGAKNNKQTRNKIIEATTKKGD